MVFNSLFHKLPHSPRSFPGESIESRQDEDLPVALDEADVLEGGEGPPESCPGKKGLVGELAERKGDLLALLLEGVDPAL